MASSLQPTSGTAGRPVRPQPGPVRQAERPVAAWPAPPALPPGISEDEFGTVITRLRAIVGAEHVVRGIELIGYLDPYAFVDADRHAPSAAFLAGSVQEVRAVLAVANEARLPVWTVSRGRNYAYGGASPRVSGSIVLDLSRMNQILEVDEQAGYALVEPGVSFSELHAHLRSIGSSLWASVPDLSWGSVIGNALERGFGYAAHGDHAANICGMEVVLADGDVVRTGMGAMAGNRAWQLYKGGYGPSLDGIFLQSNYGVVTKMGVWLQPAPETATICSVRAPEESDLALLIDTLRPLLLDGTLQGNAMVGNVLAAASMMTERSTWFSGPGQMPDDVIRAIRDATGLGWWNARCAIYGPAEVGEVRVKLVRKQVERAGLQMEATTYPGNPPPTQVHPADRAKLGIPSTDMLRMAAWRGGDPAHTDFSLVCPPNGEHAACQAQLIRRRVESSGFDYAGGFTLFPRHAIALALISFDRADPAQRSAVAELLPLLVTDAAASGYAPYRSHLAMMDVIADRFDFNDGAIRRLQRTIKDAVDPNGILSPGKQGIWPGPG